MAFVQLDALANWYWPGLYSTPTENIPAITYVGTPLLDLTGEQYAVSGRVVFPARTGSKNIARVQFRIGPLTKTGNSNFQISLQGVDLANGPPAQPDGVIGQSVVTAINTDAAFLAQTWYRTAALSSTRTVPYRDRLSVVWGFGAGGRISPDSVVIQGHQVATSLPPMSIVPALNTGGWAALFLAPVLILEFDDGTFGTLSGCVPYSAVNSHVIAAGTSYGLPFQVPVPVRVDALTAPLLFTAVDSTVDLALYAGTTLLQSVAINPRTTAILGTGRTVEEPIAVTELMPGTTYYVSITPTGAGSVTCYSKDVSNAAHWSLSSGDSTCTFTTRTGAGAWDAATPTRRLHAAAKLCAVDAAALGSGSLLNRGLN